MSELVENLTRILGKGRVNRIRQRLVIPERIEPYRIHSEKFLAVMFTARAGSTYAGELISQHRDVSPVVEWFGPKRIERRRGRKQYENDQVSVQAILDREDFPVFGMEFTVQALIVAALLGFLEQILNDTTFIVLRRRDIVAQAVSRYKAQLTGRYLSAQSASRSLDDNDFDYDEIAQRLTFTRHDYERHEEVLDYLKCDAETYYYEDIVDDPGRFQREIYSALSLDFSDDVPSETTQDRIGNSINERWINRFKEIQSQP